MIYCRRRIQWVSNRGVDRTSDLCGVRVPAKREGGGAKTLLNEAIPITLLSCIALDVRKEMDQTHSDIVGDCTEGTASTPETGLLRDARSSMPTATASSVMRMWRSVGRQLTEDNGWVATKTQSNSHSNIGADKASCSGARMGLR